jgi:hypothetical protein
MHVHKNRRRIAFSKSYMYVLSHNILVLSIKFNHVDSVLKIAMDTVWALLTKGGKCECRMIIN